MNDSVNSPPASILVRNARILTLDEQDTAWPRADIVIADGTIQALGPDVGVGRIDADTRVIEGAGLLAMPALINAHFHSPGNLMKGCLNGLPLELFMLYEVPPLAQGATKATVGRLAYVRTLLGALDMLRRGIGTVHDDAYHIPIADPVVVDAIMQAYADVGIRATVAIDQPNIVEYNKYPFLKELLPEAEQRLMERAPRQSSAELLAVYQHLLERWHGTAGGRLTAAVSCSAPQRVSVDYFEALAALSRQYDLPFNIHILETKLQRVLGEEKFGKSLVRYVHDLGLLDEHMMVIHAIWVDDQDIRLLAEAGCTVAHNPVCNLRLGSGVMPFYALRAAGIPLCLGSDEANTDDSSNMWFVGKLAALLHTIGNPEYQDWPTAPEILRMLTVGGARALRQHDNLGRLKPGYAADITLLDLDTLAFTPLNDLQRQLVFCEDGSSVRYTLVAGHVVYEQGQVSGVDEAAIRAEARELMTEYQMQLGAADSAAERLAPYYRAMYLRAAERDVGFNRWLA